jgi:hypothetical protein
MVQIAGEQDRCRTSDARRHHPTASRLIHVKASWMRVHAGHMGHGRPRDSRPDSITYAGEEFARRIYLQAWSRGWNRAQKRIFIGDGAEWIWNLADQHFPGAVQIVDLYHARQHLWELARRLHPNHQVNQKLWAA